MLESQRQTGVDVVADSMPLLDALTADRLTRQEAFLLLRSSFVHKFNHLSRCAAPHVGLPAAGRFDDMVQQALCRIGELGQHDVLPAPAVCQSSLPLRYGGLGLRSSVGVAHAAYTAGAVAAARYLNQIGYADNAESRRRQLLRESVNAMSATLSPLNRTPKILKALEQSCLSVAHTSEVVGASLNLQHVIAMAGDAALAADLIGSSR